jgi:hypothetical protein
VPETPALSALDERVAGVVHAVLEQRDGDLAALVAAAIDRELQRLVETELGGSLAFLG